MPPSVRRSQLSDVAGAVWPQAPAEVQQSMARMAAAASLATARWQTMEPYVQALPRETQEGAFHRAVLAIKKDQYEEAKQVSVMALIIRPDGTHSTHGVSS